MTGAVEYATRMGQRNYLAELEAAIAPVRVALMDAGREINYLRGVVRDLLPFLPKDDPRRVGFTEAAASHYSDTELMWRWLRAQRPLTKRIGGTYLWSKVSEEFGIGSTSAQAICRRHGFDPDTRVSRQ